MQFKIPKTYMGMPIKGAMERLFAEEEEMAKKAQTPSIDMPNNMPELSGYIYVPSAGIYMAKQRTHFGLNWYDCHKQLHKENLLMPTIPQFISYINYLKQNNDIKDATKQEIESILDDILTVRNPWRGEWLDADFKFEKELYIHYNHRTINGQLVPQNKELLTDYLTENKILGISLDDWLSNTNNHGLPKPDVKKGELYYMAPMRDNNSVARFNANSDGAGLNCNGDPNVSDASLGVFGSCKLNQQQKI